LGGSAGPGGFGNFGFGDIMDAFFGGQPRGPRSRTRRGQDAIMRIEVDLNEAVFGTERELQVETAVVCPTCTGSCCAPGTSPAQCGICRGRGAVQSMQRSLLGNVMTSRPCSACQGYGQTLPVPCPECAGEGRVLARRSIAVRVVAGVDTGTRIQLAGQAEAGPGGGPNGDLYVEVVVRPHEIFERRGHDLHARLSVPMTSAALGTTLTLDTLDGPREVMLEPGTQAGQSVRLAGLGVPPLHGRGRGDIVVHLDVETPQRLDARQRELLEELAQLRGEESVEPKLAPVTEPNRFFTRLKDVLSGR
ncbi:MAG TPA: molecular chaperone DnaJ, partial [Actinobacteria bacterium]|nr:molecular chaperone DnaJ [Actinomycetota bacterium]